MIDFLFSPHKLRYVVLHAEIVNDITSVILQWFHIEAVIKEFAIFTVVSQGDLDSLAMLHGISNSR